MERRGLLSRLSAWIETHRISLQKEQLSLGKGSRITKAQAEQADRYFTTEKSQNDVFRDAFEKGYFDDAREILNSGKPKLWAAPSRITPVKRSARIPDWSMKINKQESTVTDYCRREGKCTVVGIYFNAFGETHVQDFLTRFAKKFAKEPQLDTQNTSSTPIEQYDLPDNIQTLELNVIVSRLKSPFIRLFLNPFVRIPPARIRQYGIVYTPTGLSEALLGLKIRNCALGWIFLVDSEGRVRWSANGVVDDSEISNLVRLAGQLVK